MKLRMVEDYDDFGPFKYNKQDGEFIVIKYPSLLYEGKYGNIYISSTSHGSNKLGDIDDIRVFLDNEYHRFWKPFDNTIEGLVNAMDLAKKLVDLVDCNSEEDFWVGIHSMVDNKTIYDR